MTVTFGQDNVCRHGNLARWCEDCDPFRRYRQSDPETSRMAARSVEGIRLSQKLILDLLIEQGPMTDERIYSFHRVTRAMSPSGARTRRAELVAKGLVEDSGRELPLSSGRLATVWRAR